jgi:hypothetical protein
VWTASSAATKEHQALEIRDAGLSKQDGNYVVRGYARVIETVDASRDVKGYETFTCTFVGESTNIASSALQPAKPPELQPVLDEP